MGDVWFKEGTRFPAGVETYRYGNLITAKSIGDAESYLATLIAGFLKKPLFIDMEKAERLLSQYEKKNGYPLHEQQREAVFKVLKNRLCVLTGGPGTGKTTVLKAIAYVKRGLYPGIEIQYLAPTGKAARRVSEQTGENAYTIHSYLRLYDDDAETYGRDADMTFVDESSMLDMWMALKLFASVTGQLVLVGDTDQLPSVGEGAVLRDVIASGVVPIAQLTKTFRQDNDSVLFEAIQNIRESKLPLPSGKDFKSGLFNKKTFLNTYIEKVMEYGINNVTVLLPARKAGKYCTNKLNPKLKQILIQEDFQMNYQIGDFVMQLKNRKEAANGNIGRVIDNSEGIITVRFDGGVVHYSVDEATEQLSLAYANTVHKSQGDEYACVLVLLLDEHERQLNKNLFYTAVTRAKKECLVFYEEKGLSKAIQDDPHPAVTMLEPKIRAAYRALQNKEEA